MWRETWQNIQDGRSKCDGCPGQEAPSPMFGLGNRHSDIMLIGEEPDSNIDSSMSWADANDQMLEYHRSSMSPLWRHMMSLGLAINKAPDDLYFTNVSKCGDFDECASFCSGYIPREIAHVDPRVLILYGQNVISLILNMFGIEDSDDVSDLTIITVPSGDYNTEVAEKLKDEY